MIENLDNLIGRLEHDLTAADPGEEADVIAGRVTKLKELRRQQRRTRIRDARTQLGQ